MTNAPVLKTERLTLRRHRLDDFQAVAKLWADPRVTEYISGNPSTEAESWTRLLRYGGLWPLLGFGYWVLERRSDQRFIGEVGFADFRRQMEPAMVGVPEAGWVLSPEVFGMGYATEAVTAVHEWVDAQPGIHTTACIIQPDHTASLSLARKAGYRDAVHTHVSGSPVVQLRRTCM